MKRDELESQYGNWLLVGDPFNYSMPSGTKWKVRCRCVVHGTERNVPVYELTAGTSRRCMKCVRAHTAPQFMLRADRTIPMRVAK